MIPNQFVRCSTCNHMMMNHEPVPYHGTNEPVRCLTQDCLCGAFVPEAEEDEIVPATVARFSCTKGHTAMTLVGGMPICETCFDEWLLGKFGMKAGE